MKKIIFITLIGILFLCVSCSTIGTKPTFDRTYSNYVKVVGKNKIPRPDWVVQDISNESYHFEVGISTNPDPIESIKIARLDAKANIAAWVNSTMEIALNSTNSSSEKKEETKSVKTYKEDITQLSNAILVNTVQEDVWVSSDDITYVLVSIPVSNVENQLNYFVSKEILDKSQDQ